MAETRPVVDLVAGVVAVERSSIHLVRLMRPWLGAAGQEAALFASSEVLQPRQASSSFSEESSPGSLGIGS